MTGAAGWVGEDGDMVDRVCSLNELNENDNVGVVCVCLCASVIGDGRVCVRRRVR